MALIVVTHAVAGGRVRSPLDRLKGWFEVHYAAVMTGLLLVLGVVLPGKGIGGLS